MTASLTPALALAHLQELSVDVRAAVVLDPAGAPIVGDRTLAASARALLAGSDAAYATDGALHAARASDGGVIAVIAGDFVLAPLLADDLVAVARALVTARADLPGT